jgi:hypothetical protein
MCLTTVLKSVNGRRRERTLGAGTIITAAADLRPGEHVFLHGGHVANNYGYRAVATGAVVFKLPRKRRARVIVALVNATKGSTGFGRLDSWEPSEADVANSTLVPRNLEDE